ncbi:MAG: hypothetical protein KF784_10765 [Fimbriimonadaceae bacterium]|nr:hypothetical protein [Fimbriimonadaceae bacterium]
MEELESLKHEAAASVRVRIIWYLLALLSPILVFSGTYLAFHFQWQGLDWLIGLPFAVFAILIPMDFAKRRAAWILPRQALLEGVVEVYSGVPNAIDPYNTVGVNPDEVDNDDEEDDEPKPEPTVIQRLPRSGYILSWNGVRCQTLERAAVSASAEGNVPYASQKFSDSRFWRGKLPTEESRPLTTFEKSELELYERQLLAPISAVVLIFVAIFVLSIVVNVLSYDGIIDLIQIWFYSFLILASLVYGWIKFTEGKNVAADQSSGTVIIVQKEGVGTVEVLPTSRLTWTVNGKPAMWRFLTREMVAPK